jgi:predicted ester cyclase
VSDHDEDVRRNKEVIRRWFTDAVRGGVDEQALKTALEETIDPGFVDHDGPDPAHGRDALARALPGLLRALPDLRFSIECLMGEGDYVALRLRGEATHTGEFRGRAPTGQRLTWTENEIYRFAGGRAVESWGEGTLGAALAQAGLAF